MFLGTPHRILYRSFILLLFITMGYQGWQVYQLRNQQLHVHIPTPAHAPDFDPEALLRLQPYGQQLLNIINNAVNDPQEAAQSLDALLITMQKQQSAHVQAYVHIAWYVILQNQGRIPAAMEHIKKLQALADTYRRAWMAAFAKIEVAKHLFAEGAIDQAAISTNDAITIADAIHYHQLMPKAYNLLGVLNIYQGEFMLAQKMLLKAKAMLEGDLDNIYNGRVISNLALSFIDQEDWHSANRYLEQAVNLLDTQKQKDDLSYLAIYINFVFTHIPLGNLQEAEINLTKAQALLINVKDNRFAMTTNLAAAVLSIAQGEYNAALQAITQCLYYGEGFDNITKANCYRTQAQAYVELNKGGEALISLNKASDLFKTSSNNASNLLNLNNLYSKAYYLQGDNRLSMQYAARYYKESKAYTAKQRKKELRFLNMEFNSIEQANKIAQKALKKELQQRIYLSAEIEQRLINIILILTLFMLALAVPLWQQRRKPSARNKA